MKKICFIIIGALLMVSMIGCTDFNSNDDGIYYDAPVDDAKDYVEKDKNVETDELMETNDTEAINDSVETNDATNETESEDEKNDVSLDSIDEDDIKYKIFSNDLITGFIEGKELAKTGDPAIDGFLQRFYEKALHGDNYIQFFLDNAEQYGVDTSVIDKLIEINADRKIGIWLEDLKDYLSENETETTEE